MSKKDEGLVQHCVGVRYRVRGAGNLRTIIHSFDEAVSGTLNPLLMDDATARLPMALANFRSQGMQVEFKTTQINETFTISRIIAYVKPTATGYPII